MNVAVYFGKTASGFHGHSKKKKNINVSLFYHDGFLCVNHGLNSIYGGRWFNSQ